MREARKNECNHCSTSRMRQAPQIELVAAADNDEDNDNEEEDEEEDEEDDDNNEDEDAVMAFVMVVDGIEEEEEERIPSVNKGGKKSGWRCITVATSLK